MRPFFMLNTEVNFSIFTLNTMINRLVISPLPNFKHIQRAGNSDVRATHLQQPLG